MPAFIFFLAALSIVVKIELSRSHSVHDVSLVKGTTEEKMVSILLSTFKQPRCLQAQLLTWSSCALVHTIFVNTFEGDDTLGYSEIDTKAVPVIVFDKLPNQLTNRFLPRIFPTLAVFTVDVDTFYSCAVLKLLFNIWQKDQNATVGVHPRLLLEGHRKNWSTSYKYPYEWNALLVTKGAMHHKVLLDAFFKEKYAAARAEVDKALTGEDFLMAFVVALEFQSGFKLVCINTNEACHMTCHEGVGPLTKRSGGKRYYILQFLFQSFGNPLKTLSGTHDIAWQHEPPAHKHWHQPGGICTSYPQNRGTLKKGGCKESHWLKTQ